ncbi:hypothetical protein C0Q70_15875 [Pomacea canaliculata]|uniref:Uncharacterized protein n=1 Tax=Pomacea canaliculata TaxID=400727 RepID=A0A2T7NW25_POMCA|nr:hypothetical protein C0Q70_15875 [Pomacea canaliculata]
MQAICDVDMILIDVVAKLPGILHDARVLKESGFFDTMEQANQPGNKSFYFFSFFSSLFFLLLLFLLLLFFFFPFFHLHFHFLSFLPKSSSPVSSCLHNFASRHPNKEFS